MITLAPLSDAPVRHASFTREGGVSEGLYASRNVGFGSQDDPAKVAENRRRCMADLGLPAGALVTVYQVHSPEVVTVEAPFGPADAPKADALVTKVPGVALGILTADCAPVLFCDPSARVVGAAHAGWKGAVGGVLEATVAAMEALGADRSRILAGIGPHISARAYEVGPEFRERLLETGGDNAAWFAPSARGGHFLFDLGGYAEARLRAAGVASVERAPHCTLLEDRFFSYRRTTLAGEPDYGRQLSAISLRE
ncbi:MAG TPA: peptidoglycan editing factor PgeF [Azospirillaceae bacterium]|nr:peptidoglycan editing factor PgeF [Azospirillaceae bacterium]